MTVHKTPTAGNGDQSPRSTTLYPAPTVAPFAPRPTDAKVAARALTDTDAYYPTYDPYSYSTPDWYTDTDYSYSIPSYSYSIPSYSIPSYDIPSYTWTPPSITVPDYSYPTAGSGSGGGKGTDALPEIATEMKKINWKKIGGAIAGSVTGFFGLLGGIWAGCKRKARRAMKGPSEVEKYALHGRMPSGVPSLGYQPNHGFGTVNEPLLGGGYYPQVRSNLFLINHDLLGI